MRLLPEIVRKFAALLTPRARRQLLALCAMAALAGLLETAAVATLMPFLAMLADPEVIGGDPRFAPLHALLGSESGSRPIA